MDLFKRIQNLSAIYDDDGPSAMVPESRPMFADSVRPGFYRGESVVKSHGQKLIELTEAGESSTSIAKKLGLKQQTVSNALNAIDKGTAGDEYKLSKPLKDFFKPKNQFSGKELTKNTELIEAIKEDAPTMSDKEIKAKYDIHKSTLKKIKDENDITTRSSYLPEGKQKKSIPYAERYTAQEKSDMYKKRKDTETEEDRIKAKERDKKYRDKKFKEYKMEPSSRSPYDDLWKDIARSSKEGDRIQLIEGPKYSSGASYDDFKTRVFLDTKTGETFNYNNLKQYLDSGKLEGVSYNSVIEPYDIKNQIANSGLKEDIQKAYFGEKYKPPKPFRAQNTFHVHHIGGVASDPFSVQLTFADQNLGLVTNKKFNKEWASLIERNAPLSERKNYLKFVKSKTGDNIAQTLEFPEVGKTRTFGEIGTDMQKLLSNEKFEPIKEQIKIFKKMGYRCNKSGGGAEDVACYLDDVKQTRADLKSSDINVRAKAITKQRNALNVAKKLPEIGKVLRRVGQGTLAGVTTTLKALGFTSPIGYAIEGVVEGGLYDYYRKKGYNHEQSLAETLTPGLVSGRPEGVPWYGGAEKLLEKELSEVREKPTILEDGTIVPGKVIEGKVSDPKILQYQQALKDQEQFYDAFGRKVKYQNLQGTDQGTYKKLASDASADIQDLYRSGTVSNINRIMNPESMASQAYNTAVERQLGLQDERARDYKAKNYAQKEPSEFMQERKLDDRNKAMLEMFPTYTPEIIDSMYERANIEKPENLDYADFAKQMSDYDKMSYFADNFRTEKAGGGIAKMAGDRSGAMTTSMNPDSQGLQGLFNRVKKV